MVGGGEGEIFAAGETVHAGRGVVIHCLFGYKIKASFSVCLLL